METVGEFIHFGTGYTFNLLYFAPFGACAVAAAVDGVAIAGN